MSQPSGVRAHPVPPTGMMVILIAVLAAAGGAPAGCGSVPDAPGGSGAAVLGPGFEDGFAAVNGTTLHYVRGGTGPAVILLHGFPQDWYEFREVMPRLARAFMVVAVDLRGVGLSEPATTGYDAANMAEDIHQLAAHLRVDRAYVVGHDIGGLVAYALARRAPESLRG